MARIRTIKPDFFRSAELYEAEIQSGLPIRVAFAGLWTAADREGRFKWKPAELKLDCLPHDLLDFKKVLEVLCDTGSGEGSVKEPFVVRYEVDGTAYGIIPGFKEHQRPPHTEEPSRLPSPSGKIRDIGPYPNERTRREIYERDSFSCLYCAVQMREKTRLLCLDHVIPLSKGGSNYAENLATSCKKCNAQKGNNDPERAGMRWPNSLGRVAEEVDCKDGLTDGQRGVNGIDSIPDKEGKGKEGKGKEGKGRESMEAAPAAGAEKGETWTQAEVLAQRLKGKITANDPKARIPNDLGSWICEAERILRLDKRPVSEVERLIDWAAADHFWKSNILSMSKFRQKYTTLLLQSQRSGGLNGKGRVVGGAAPKPGKYAGIQD